MKDYQFRVGLSEWHIQLGDETLCIAGPLSRVRFPLERLRGLFLETGSSVDSIWLEYQPLHRRDTSFAKLPLDAGDPVCQAALAELRDHAGARDAWLDEGSACAFHTRVAKAAPAKAPPPRLSFERLLPTLSPKHFQELGIVGIPDRLYQLASALEADGVSAAREAALIELGHRSLFDATSPAGLVLDGGLAPMWVITPKPPPTEGTLIDAHFGYQEIEAAPYAEVQRRIDGLRAIIAARIDACERSSTAVNDLIEGMVEELQELGHKLGRIDYNGDTNFLKNTQRWGSYWTAGTNGLQICFSATQSEVSWVIGPEVY